MGMTLTEMLDLPRAERSRHLAAIPLTVGYTFWAMEDASIRFVRRTIVRHGGTYRECYRMPGVFWVATFRDQKGMRRCTTALVKWLNDGLRKSQHLHEHLTPEEFEEMLYSSASFPTREVVPSLAFEKDVWITAERRVVSGFHPITGRSL